ncbi:MAG: class I SAM-dependent methyltransferase [Lachnospiraceae bacterium]|nr:class I SAM-dependent methyltransferase [Lachnospiraceae bacterium]
MIQDKDLRELNNTIQSAKSDEELQKLMQESHSWTYMYHLAKGRTNLIEWLPENKEAKVLEIGAECGALTGMLARKYGAVVCLEVSQEKSEINQVRNGKLENVNFLTGRIEQVQESDFNLIFLVGSLPLAESYVTTKDDAYRTLLENCRNLLKADGRMILALPNKLGLKYFAGCREDYFGAPFTGVEDYYYHKGMRTFGKNELTTLLKNAGFDRADWYYPYPDYRFMTSLYSDQYQPREGELTTNLVNYDQERYVLFDEAKAFDTLIREDLYREHANSFLVITGKKPISDIVFSKYSAERDPQYALRTDIRYQSIDGQNSFEDKMGEQAESRDLLMSDKTALLAEGKSHIAGIKTAYDHLTSQYAGSGIEIGPCRPGENKKSVTLDFIPGQNLQRLMEELIIQGRGADVKRIVDAYTKRILSAATDDFAMTDDFRRVFGGARLPEGLKTAKISDIDLIFSNLIIPDEAGDDIEKIVKADWSVIDYEWTFDFPIPVHFILHRCFYLATHQLMACPELNFEELIKGIGISPDESEQYLRMEEYFQNTIQGSLEPERNMLTKIGNGIIPFAEMDRTYREEHAVKDRIEHMEHELDALRQELASFGMRKALMNKFFKK